MSVTVDADVSPFVRGLATASTAAKGFSHELESADGRMANLVQAGLALAPALVPLGAAVVPALAGLTAQLGATAVAAGVTVLAFNGVGDALKALNDYTIAPTDAHMAKLNQTMNALGPAGVVFVHQIQQIRPELQQLQDVAQQGLLPGLAEDIDRLMTLQPQVERFIGHIAQTLSGMGDDASRALTSPKFVEFLDFLDREAGPTLEAMGKTLGNVLSGLGSMIMAFNPLATDFTTGMVHMSESFKQWSEGLDSSAGFQNFIDYVRESGPQALETLGALANMLIDFAKAAAPVGAVVLPIVTDLANVLGDLADSPVGPVIIGAAAAIGTLGRSLALLKAVGLRGSGDSIIGQALKVDSIKGALPAIREAAAATTELKVAESEAALAHSKYIGALRASSVRQELIPGAKATAGMVAVTDELVAANKKQVDAAARVAEAEKTKAAAIRSSLTGLGRASAVVGGLALATSGYADESGLANTATYSLMGMIAGPWGAAVGGGIGLMQDFRHANDNFVTSMHAIDDALDQGATGFGVAAGKIRTEMEGIQDLRKQLAAPPSFSGFADSLNPRYWDEFIQHFGDFSHMYQDEVDGINAKNAELVAGEDALYQVGLSLGKKFQRNSNGSIAFALDDLMDVASRATPAMHALGYSLDDLKNMSSDELRLAADRMANWTKWSDTGAGRTKALAKTFRELDNDMYSTSQSAADLQGALESLLSPKMNLSAAADAWTTALRHMKDDLSDSSHVLGPTDGAIKNRGAVRSRVTDMEALLKAQADAGASADQLTAHLKRQRKALIEAGDAAGLNRGELVKYIDELGLTPKLVRTIMNLDISPAERALAKARAELAAMDKMHATAIIELHTIRTGAGGQAPGYVNNAEGNILTFANGGDVRNGHQPEFAGPGPARVWREQETGGESYIPHANDSRRPRAMAITEQTASLFGGKVIWNDRGNVIERQRVTIPAPVARAVQAAGGGVGALAVTGTLNTPWGPAEVEGIARGVARDEIAADHRFKRVSRGD